jgi:HAD superfamily hydrolase (TIGR01662 family)
MGPAARRASAVFVDIGETLLDRTAEYAAWADWLAVPRHTFSAVFGAVVAAGGGVADVIARFRPGERLSVLRKEIDAIGAIPTVADSDLYPGARAALAQLRGAGWFVGVAGNQPAAIGDQVRALRLPVDCVLASAELAVSKPRPGFFAALADRAGRPAAEVVYVGDQLDKDVVAARRAGMQVVRVLTGPWGRLCRDAEVEAQCLAVIDSIADLGVTLGSP